MERLTKKLLCTSLGSLVCVLLSTTQVGCKATGGEDSDRGAAAPGPADGGVVEARRSAVDEDEQCPPRPPNTPAPPGCPPQWADDATGSLHAFRTSVLVQHEVFSDCFAALGPSGRSSEIPPRSAKCHLAPNKQCQAVDDGEVVEPWQYVAPMEDRVWKLFEFEPKRWGRADIFHKSIHWKEEDGVCTLEVHLEGDVNGDGDFGFYAAAARFPVGMTSIDDVELVLVTDVPERPDMRPSPEKALLPR